MLRKTRYQNHLHNQELLKHDCSTQTDSSDSLHHHQTVVRHNFKEKLQLCKKFTQYGYCPYGHRCKFAHGCHQLRKNNQKNKLYKTKQCFDFFQNGYCHYGSRCNFKHHHQSHLTPKDKQQIWKNFGDLFRETRQSSRLLTLLN